MRNLSRKVAIVGGARTPFVKSFGLYSDKTNKEMLSFLLNQIAREYNLKNKILGDVALGAVIKDAKDFNLSREAVLNSDLHPKTPAFDVQRACGTGVEAISLIANKISTGQIEIGVAGGSDSNSDAPISFGNSFKKKIFTVNKAKSFIEKIAALSKLTPFDFKPIFPSINEPQTGLSMGQHTELMAQKWNITREEQDFLAFESHKKASKAYEEGFYNGLVFEFSGVKKDQFVRSDIGLEKLAKLKPAFKDDGTLTAGNSTPLTDGASVVLLASEEYAKNNGLPILGYLEDVQFTAVDFINEEGLLMAPTHAVNSLLLRNNLSLQDFDYYEIHEAFAAQALANMKAWESESYSKEKLGRDKALGPIDRNKLNIKGGSVALGHPFAATGGRLIATISKILTEKNGKRGLVSACTAGGMGIAAIVSRE